MASKTGLRPLTSKVYPLTSIFLLSHKQLRASKEFAVRFSEVDAMNIVWHGSYPLYFRMPAKPLAHNTDWNI